MCSSTGPIGLAMRSTMSLPGIFAPVRDGDNLYVDGALVDNLPTDVVRQMGPDVVIAIHLQVSPTTADDLRSMFSVLGRSIDVASANSEVRGMEGADIVVKVDVQKFSAMDYNKADALIQQGMQAAEEKSKILLPYALDQAAWDEYVARRDARKRRHGGRSAICQKWRVPAPPRTKRSRKFSSRLVGKPINTPVLEGDLTRLTGTGKFDSASYGLTQKDGELGLLVTVHEKTYAPPVLQPAFVVDGTQPDNVTFTMGGRLTFLDIAGYGSELRTDFACGKQLRHCRRTLQEIYPDLPMVLRATRECISTMRYGSIPTRTLKPTTASVGKTLGLTSAMRLAGSAKSAPATRSATWMRA